MNQSFLFFELFFVSYSALPFLSPHIYVAVEQFEAENISLLSGRLVFITFLIKNCLFT